MNARQSSFQLSSSSGGRPGNSVLPDKPRHYEELKRFASDMYTAMTPIFDIDDEETYISAYSAGGHKCFHKYCLLVKEAKDVVKILHKEFLNGTVFDARYIGYESKWVKPKNGRNYVPTSPNAYIMIVKHESVAVADEIKNRYKKKYFAKLLLSATIV